MLRRIKQILLVVIGLLFLVLLGTVVNNHRIDNRNAEIHRQAVEEFFAAPQQQKIYKAETRAFNKRQALQDRIDSIVTISSLHPVDQGTVLWFDETKWGRDISAATSKWNKVNLGVKFEETFDRNKAELFFVTDDKILDYFSKGIGMGMMASNGDSNSDPGIIILNSNINDWLIRSVMPKTAQHEIGHYLGLEHNTSNNCSIMSQGEACYKIPNNRCGLDSLDRRQLLKFYSSKSKEQKFNFNAIEC